jgi:hypothetical protein
VDRKDIFEQLAKGDDRPPSDVRPLRAGWWRIGLDPERVRDQHRFALRHALQASLAELGPTTFGRALRRHLTDLHGDRAEQALDDLVERLLPTDLLSARRRTAEAAKEGDPAYDDEVFEPGTLVSSAHTVAMGWGLTEDDARCLLAIPLAEGLINKRTRTRARLVMKMAVLLRLKTSADPGFTTKFLTTRDERYDFVPLRSLQACSTDRLRLIWRALHWRVYGREP